MKPFVADVHMHSLLSGHAFGTIRELAAEAGVNPNTMQRAITQLETLGLVTTNRTLGRTVTENAGALDMAQAERKKNDE